MIMIRINCVEYKSSPAFFIIKLDFLLTVSIYLQWSNDLLWSLMVSGLFLLYKYFRRVISVTADKMHATEQTSHLTSVIHMKLAGKIEFGYSSENFSAPN